MLLQAQMAPLGVAWRQHTQRLLASRRGGVAQAETARQARLRGPQAFPLERLLAVYWALLRAHTDAPPPAAAEQSAEVLMQLATLASLRLLSRARFSQAQHACLVSRQCLI